MNGIFNVHNQSTCEIFDLLFNNRHFIYVIRFVLLRHKRIKTQKGDCNSMRLLFCSGVCVGSDAEKEV